MDVAGPQRCGVRRKFLRHYDIVRQVHGATGVIGRVHDLVRGSRQIMFAQRLADIHTARGEESIGHAAADDQVLDAADQIFENVELGRDLGPAHHCCDRRFRVAERGVEGLEFGLHRASRIGRKVMRQSFGRGMGAVRSREGVVDVEIAVGGNALGKFGVVGFFARPEADIVQQADIAIAQDADRLFDHRAHDLGDEHDLLAQHFFHVALHEAGRHGGVALSLRTAVMSQQQDLRALLGQFENGRLHRFDARHVSSGAVLHRQVEIDAHERDLACNIAEVVEGPEAGHHRVP